MNQIKGLLSPRLAITAVIVSGFGLAFLFFLLNVQSANGLDANNCLSCHSKLDAGKTTADGRNVSLKINADDFNNSAHKFLDCTSCHGTSPHDNPAPLSKLASAQLCGTCHQYEYQQYLTSIHGQQLSKGNTDVPTCVDCHSVDGDPHSVMRVLDPGASTYKKNIADTCGKCHNNQDLMDGYGIVENVYETYMQSFHGKAIALGSDELTKLSAATCTNCHGVHNIKAVNDPTSPVGGMDNLVQTCDQCHPGAGEQFVKGFLGHKEASPSFVPAAHYVEKSFGILTYSVIGLGAIIVIGAIFGYSRRHWRR